MRKENKGGGMMERLTNSIDYCQLHCDFGKSIECSFSNQDNCYERSIQCKLREYENLDEQGLLLRLPCKVGDKVFKLKQPNYCPAGICRKVISCSECRANTPFLVSEGKFMLKELKEIGKTVFLTQAEAEQKLKEMESK